MKLIPNFSSRKLLLLLLLLCGVWLSLSAVGWWMTSRDSYHQSLLYICLPTMHCTSQQEMRKAPLWWHTHTHTRKKTKQFPTFQFCHFLYFTGHSCGRLTQRLVMNVFHKHASRVTTAAVNFKSLHCVLPPSPPLLPPPCFCFSLLVLHHFELAVKASTSLISSASHSPMRVINLAQRCSSLLDVSAVISRWPHLCKLSGFPPYSFSSSIFFFYFTTQYSSFLSPCRLPKHVQYLIMSSPIFP